MDNSDTLAGLILEDSDGMAADGGDSILDAAVEFDFDAMPEESGSADSHEADATSTGVAEDFATDSAVCHNLLLLTIRSWPEFKTEMEKHCWKVMGKKICANRPRPYTRKCTLKAYARVCHTKAAHYRNQIIQAVKEAVAAGVVVGVISGNVAAATAALKTYLINKLRQQLTPTGQITVSITTSKTCGDWTRV